METTAKTAAELRARMVRRFEQPDEVQETPFGRFEIVRVGGVALGRTTYRPGWRWSEHVGGPLGRRWCDAEHIIVIVSGAVAVAFPDGRTVEFHAGEILYVAPNEPHDAWVVGPEPYVSLQFLKPATPEPPGA